MGYKSQETRALISSQGSCLQCALMSGGVNVSLLRLPGAPKSVTPAGIAAFEKEYAHWVEEQDKRTNALMMALHSPLADKELDDLVKDTLNHYANLFTIKATAAKADVCYLISGAWKTSTERQFMWIGGFRPSDLFKVFVSQLDLVDQQSHDLYNLNRACQEAEDSLSQGMEKLQQTLAEAVAFGQALDKLEYVRLVLQADFIRHETMQPTLHYLTTRQAAQGLISLGEYCHLSTSSSSGFSCLVTFVNPPNYVSGSSHQLSPNGVCI